MRKLLLSLTVIALVCLGSVTSASAHMDCEEINEVNLTDAKKSELEALTKTMFDQKKLLISKYVEFGVVSEETGEKMVKKLDKRYQKLAEEGFIPKWNKYCKDKTKK
ncbi:DUF2680 domain-containing protein [Anaerobacillus alkaliphilus]|uniref:DUF2680 domain-containing protein n=1 Tax=Anaerobacillus alkaliphilus TaxID=1548597 RepID=A0A4Q0VXL8_9BACI|nr:DUF2680 domain-containing protein [Anaerobacillus alkaliphilus]RXJ04142.1 DUF2680 domain-containing protein [Anaerobacillus alkaliphilus]